MGKREVGELDIIDFVLSMLLSQIIAISIENYKEPFLYAFVPIALLVLLQIVLSFVTLKSFKFRKIFNGKESIIINKGILNIKEMIKQRYSLNDLLLQLRDSNIRTIEEVDYAVLENNGKLSVFKKDDKDKDIFPLPLIIDGHIEETNLECINRDKNWLLNSLIQKRVGLDEVFYAFYKGNNVYFIKKN
jgi:uncharacterized membrane protein YcaP (DUF421 family)